MKSLDVVLSRAGIYAVVTPHVLGFIEVEAGGRCFQLELASGTYARDGELRAGGLNLDAILSFEGPFGRLS